MIESTRIMNSTLNKTYYTPRESSAFSNAEYIHHILDKKEKIPKPKIRKWLKEQETHSIHKPVRRRFKRQRVIVSGIDDQWQTDLADLSKLSEQNSGFRYLLGCID